MYLVFSVHLTLLDHAIARLVLSVCLSIRLCICHIPVFVQMNEDNDHSSFWGGKVYLDIRRGSPLARALK